ncbi:MAG: RNA-binding transcriptional accessory protein [Deltaproteobacteria bacterium]|nr:RNA-binding transcriptional accessory protein [Deltaproteobacteria bacterium]
MGDHHAVEERVTAELLAEIPGLRARAVAAVLALLDEGATVPFIARYRKERTGGLDEVAIRRIDVARARLVELDKRRQAIVAALTSDGLLTPALADALARATTKPQLEDLYLPFKKKRKTRASAARERGLGPLAERILAQPRTGDPRREASAFVSPEKAVPDVDAALAGARDIVAEVVAERPDLRQATRDVFKRQARVTSSAVKKTTEGQRTRFEDYYAYGERADRIPSHRYLAIDRGEEEGFLKVKLELDDERVVSELVRRAGHDARSPFARELVDAVADGYARLLRPAIDNEVRAWLKARADAEAVDVFAKNLEAILLAPPLGESVVLAIDPGFRTGCKCVVLDATGALVAHTTIFPHTGDAARATRDLLALVDAHAPAAIAVGNGTGGRETEAFVRAALGPRRVIVVAVSEAGASVYSASDLAREEMPDLDLTYRGAVSIGRRLQDPLAELVKVEPRALGVGQYQHDVDQALLADRLDAVVETAVNRVGVELNTASAPLLGHVAGIGPALARAIVEHRNVRGPFRSRRQLLEVSGLGPVRFEQCAGFLRVRRGEHPLDASAVHPERYALVERIAADLGTPLARLVGDAQAAARIDPRRYVAGDVGEPTLADIVRELARPGRDPRASFEAPAFRDDVNKLDDLEPGMELDGVVTNVTNFGAFVDVGVHQDGLVHVSELADRFVRDPHEVARPGQRIKVRVLSVDRERKRIALSARAPR